MGCKGSKASAPKASDSELQSPTLLTEQVSAEAKETTSSAKDTTAAGGEGVVTNVEEKEEANVEAKTEVVPEPGLDKVQPSPETTKVAETDGEITKTCDAEVIAVAESAAIAEVAKVTEIERVEEERVVEKVQEVVDTDAAAKPSQEGANAGTINVVEESTLEAGGDSPAVPAQLWGFTACMKSCRTN